MYIYIYIMIYIYIYIYIYCTRELGTRWYRSTVFAWGTRRGPTITISIIANASTNRSATTTATTTTRTTTTTITTTTTTTINSYYQSLKPCQFLFACLEDCLVEPCVFVLFEHFLYVGLVLHLVLEALKHVLGTYLLSKAPLGLEPRLDLLEHAAERLLRRWSA